MLHRTIKLPEAYMFELYSKSDAQPAPPSGLEQALWAPVGAASPLWLIIGGAAGAGMAYWWATQWLRPVNLDAVLPRGTESPVKAPLGGEAAPLADAAFVAAAQRVEEPVGEWPKALGAVTPTVEISAPEPLAEPASFAPEAQPVVEVASEVALAPPAIDGIDMAEPPAVGRKGKTPPAPPQA